MTLPTPLHTRAPSGPPCVGRDADLSQVLDALDQHKGGSFIAVTGQAGIGKSTFLVEAKRRLGERGVTVFDARCRPGLSSLQPIAALLRRILAQLCDEAAPPALTARTEALLAAFQGLGLPGSGVALLRDRSGNLRDRIALFEQLGLLLRDVAGRRRIALVLHDVDVADAGTREVVAYLARELTSPPELSDRRFPGLLVVSGATLSAIGPARWSDGVALLHIPLEGMGRDGVRAYLSNETVLERILELTDGVPQRLESLLTAEQARRIPSPLTQATDAERTLLEVLAIFGRPLTAETLVALTEQSQEVLAAAVANLVRRQIIEKTVSDGALRVAFRRVGDERAVYGSLDQRRRLALHAKVGYHLRGEDLANCSDLEACADHLLLGRCGSDAVDAAERAAEALEISFCYERAADLYERALSQADAGQQRRLLCALRTIYANTAQLDRAVEIAEKIHVLDPRDLEADFELARLHLRRGDFGAARQRLAPLEGRASELGDDALQACILAERAEADSLDGQRDAAQRAAEEGLELCADDHAPTTRLGLQNTLAKLALEQGDVQRARQLFGDNLRRANDAGLLAETARAHIQLGLAALQASDYGAAEGHYEAGRQLAADIGEHRYLGACLQHLGVLAERRRDYGNAIRCYQQAVSSWKKVGHRSYLAWVGLDLAKLYLDLGAVGRATAMLGLAEKLADAEPPVATRINRELLRGRLAQANCRYVDAAQHLRRAEDLAASVQGQKDRVSRAKLALAALALERQDSSEAARHVAEVMETGTGGALRVRALLLHATVELRDRPEVARSALVEALELAAELEDDEASWEAHYHLAMLARREGREAECRRRLLDAAQIEARVREGVPKDLRDAVAEQPLRVALRAALCQGEEAAPLVATPSPRIEASRKAPFPGIIGAHPRIQQVLAQVEKVARTDATVLIRGESGTGKELIADAIHSSSERRDRALVKVNCGALVESLLLSELFGHERGAFTGATQRKIGRFELAQRGTIFLDEIGDISPKTQVALLRVLQERRFERVGGTSAIDVDVRILFATNRNLEQMVSEGSFREDLYYRLRGVQIDLPPLRERASDIAPLAAFFLQRIARERGCEPKGLDTSAVELLTRHGWPGNIRELENVLRSVSLFADDRLLGASDFSDYPELATEQQHEGTGADDAGGTAYTDLRNQGLSLRDFKKQVEAACIREALTESEGNITRAAELLGMKRPRLSQLIKEHGLASR